MTLLADVSPPPLPSPHRIMANANGCAPLAGNVWPNFVMLDFVNIGQGQQAVDQMNGFV
jgi:hypothetical protein